LDLLIRAQDRRSTEQRAASLGDPVSRSEKRTSKFQFRRLEPNQVCRASNADRLGVDKTRVDDKKYRIVTSVGYSALHSRMVSKDQ